MIIVFNRPTLIKMPAKMEPHFGEKRKRRDENSITDDALQDLDFITAPVEDEYTEAYQKGKEGSCWNHYKECSINLFKMINL